MIGQGGLSEFRLCNPSLAKGLGTYYTAPVDHWISLKRICVENFLLLPLVTRMARGRSH